MSGDQQCGYACASEKMGGLAAVTFGPPSAGWAGLGLQACLPATQKAMAHPS